MKPLLGIGETARLSGLTVKALRLYHEEGIVEPARVDPRSGYRYYAPEQLVHLEIVKYCRSVGVGVKELRRLFAARDTEALLAFLSRKKAEVEAGIAKMERVIDSIDALDRTVARARRLLERDEVAVLELPERVAVALELLEREEESEALAYSRLARLLAGRGFAAGGYGMGYSLRAGNARPAYVFALLEERPVDSRLPLKILPGGPYLVMSYTWQSQEAQMAKLKAYARERSLEVDEFLELDLATDFFDPLAYACQLQMPLSRRDAARPGAAAPRGGASP